MPSKLQRLANELANDPDLKARTLSRLKRELINGVLLSDIARGITTAEEIASPQGMLKYAEMLLDRLKTGEVKLAVDHTTNLRRIGSRYERNSDTALAATFYATWVEHVLNELITVAVGKREQPDAMAKQIIRDASLSAKMTWLMALLGYPPIPAEHITRLRKLADIRNAFIHYKWNYENPDLAAGARASESEFLVQCRKSLEYLARYRTRALHGGAKAKVREISSRAGDA